MANYSQSKVLSIRVTPELLDAVREQARIEGRSVSGEIVALLKQQLELRTRARTTPRKISGWLAHLDVPETHAAFREGRSALGAIIQRRLRGNAVAKRSASR